MKSRLSGARVLVTGADGFIGSHLVEALVTAGATVRAFVYYNSWNSIGWLSDLSPAMQSSLEILRGDIRDAERVVQAVEGQEWVFHLSSLIGIPYSYESPRAYVSTNISGALSVLEACRRSSTLVRLVHTSTSEVYGTAQTVPIPESHPLVGQSPYSASKIGADMLAESFHRSYSLPVVIARPFNTFGPRQTARAIIPTIASQLLSGCDALRLGALTPTRDFNYVTDTVAGLLALAACDESGGRAVNIGTGLEWSIGDTAKLLMEIIGRAVPIQAETSRLRPSGSEVERLCADSRQITSLTGWSPEVPFRRGLELTVDWIRRNLHHFDSTKYAT